MLTFAFVLMLASPALAHAYPAYASWYGEELAGNLTASGEPFDPYRYISRFVSAAAPLKNCRSYRSCACLGVAVRLMYTSSTPTHTNNGEQM
jgi:hypothetical protein